ncbi:SURF1 family protein [Haliea sp. E1-2-M8]|uniref:SURF1 family protein n=1 Tax=Haliea sp. E1-2-M8 TaxID=3064706 RepID=UPI00271860BA|nr:SURF1 family protein [Haliea sp. E1-2-M8]MDO8862814.1 SURF1 family protein [Haliea sp. E1-2-M8]
MAGLQLDLEWRITLATALLLPALIALGFWQLERAEEKAELQARWSARQSEAPVPLTALAGSEPGQLAYRRVSLQGEFLTGHYLLLDNRVQQGRFGNEVVGLLALADSDRVVLVNRGWVPSDPARLVLPQVAEPDGPVTLTGHIYVTPGKPYLLGEQHPAPPWPVRIQALDTETLAPLVATVTGAALYPHPVRIDSGQPGALTVAWQLVNASPEKHQGYAVQWFSMAAVLAFFFLLRSSNLWQLLTRKQHEA